MATLEECGIRFLSASSINNYVTNPAWWTVRHMMGVKQPVSAALIRSAAIKAGLKHWLYKGSEDLAEDVALEHYSLETSSVGLEATDEKTAKEQDAILPMLHEFCKLFHGAGLKKIPLAVGVFNTVLLDGVTVPFITCPDFVFDDCVVDVSASHKMPGSTLPPKDLQTSGLHMLFRGDTPIFRAYATMKRSALVPVGEAEAMAALLRLREDAAALERALEVVSTAKEMLALVPLKPDHWLWSPDMLKVAKEAIPQLPPQERERHGIQSARAKQFRAAPGRGTSGVVLPGRGPGDAGGDDKGGDEKAPQDLD